MKLNSTYLSAQLVYHPTQIHIKKEIVGLIMDTMSILLGNFLELNLKKLGAILCERSCSTYIYHNHNSHTFLHACWVKFHPQAHLRVLRKWIIYCQPCHSHAMMLPCYAIKNKSTATVNAACKYSNYCLSWNFRVSASPF